MILSPLLIVVAAQAAPESAIVVTAAREPGRKDEAPVSATLVEAPEIDGLAFPDAADLLRLTPGLAFAPSGPRGSQTQVRIRGAEANHTLLFVDGIRFNDPAAGNEARFELLASDTLSRIEVVRGPQSALWGSEALGGVVAVDSADPRRARGVEALGEYGSLESGRASARGAARAGPLALAASGAWMGSRGIDSFMAGGERDGFDTSAASVKAIVAPAPGVELGLVGHWIEGRSEFDGSDPATFAHAETLDETKNRIGAGRAWARADLSGWALSADASWLGSRNRNFLADAPLNRTGGERIAAGAQVSKTLGGHRLTAAYSHETERFHAR